MKFIKTNIPEVIIVEPNIIKDERGYFFESFNQTEFTENVGDVNFVQDNQSLSKKGVLRGLHYQLMPKSQAKLVRVIEGEVLDVAVDIRKGSPTYGQYAAVKLSADNQKQLFVPKGFAHGFIVLSSRAIFFYKCDNFYSKEHERGIKYDDPDINIDWILPAKDLIVSEKDKNSPYLQNVENNFSI